MKKYYFYFSTKYRAQKVAKWLWKHWKNESSCLEALKGMLLDSYYKNDWKRVNNLILAYSV